MFFGYGGDDHVRLAFLLGNTALAAALLGCQFLGLAAEELPLLPTGYEQVADGDGPSTAVASHWWVLAGNGSYGVAKDEFRAQYAAEGWSIGLADPAGEDPGVFARSPNGKDCVEMRGFAAQRLYLVQVAGLSEASAAQADAYADAIVIIAGNCIIFVGPNLITD